jgi:hypothetical protein
METKIKAIITGASGMVGEGVLLECLQHPQVESVLVLTRKTCGISHPKLKEIIHQDFFDVTPIEKELAGYNACYFCLGVTSVGKKEPEYYSLTYTLTMHFAQAVSGQNTDMTFCYVSGAHTDSSEQGKTMWARVKGKTENDLARLPFKQEFNFRPGFMKATKGQKNTPSLYKYIGWLYPVFKVLMPNMTSTLAEVGQAMINATLYGYETRTIEVKDIKRLADVGGKK